jgi:hypothetical protein
MLLLRVALLHIIANVGFNNACKPFFVCFDTSKEEEGGREEEGEEEGEGEDTYIIITTTYVVSNNYCYCK